MDLDPAAALKALQSRNFGGHSARLGIRYHDRGPDWVELALPFSHDLRVARSIAFTRGIAHDGDLADPVAHVAATFMVPSGTYPKVAP